MSLSVALLVGTLASAGAAEPVVDATPRREAVRLYPRRLYADWSVERRCVVQVTLGERGRPADIRPEDCEEALFRWTRRRVWRDRWDREAPEGSIFSHTVTYAPPTDAALADPSYFRRRAGETCKVRVDVAPSGEPSFVEAEDGCRPELVAWTPTPEAWLHRVVPRACTLTFILYRGEPRGLDLFRCEQRLWPLLREGLAAWTWPDSPDRRPVSLQVRFQDERDEAWVPRESPPPSP